MSVTMLSEILQNMMNFNKLVDKKKESLIIDTIAKVTDIMNRDECLATLRLGLRFV